MDKEVDKVYCAFTSMFNSASCFNSRDEYLHQQRSQLDPIIFNSLRYLHGSRLEDHWNTYKIPEKSDKAIVFVERRCHPNLEFCLHNAAYFARGYSIHIVCSHANLNFIKTLCVDKDVYIHILFENAGTPKEGRDDYNKLLKTSAFWNLFQEEHILTMETDCYLIKQIPDSIYKYDYVASRWAWFYDKPGGGGLSYRKRSVMKEICERYSDLQMQDIFASEGIESLCKKFPSYDESMYFFTESISSDQAIGVHQWWTFIPLTLDEETLLYLIKCYLTLEAF